MSWRGILGRRQDGWGRRGWGGVLILAAFGALVLAVDLYARFGFGTLAGISSGSMKPHMDFDVFWHSARALWDGRNIYHGTGGPDVSAQPPLWTVLVSPLALLEPLTAYRAFVLISLPISVGYLAWTADVLGLRVGWAVVLVGTLLVSSPLLGTLALGQMYPIVALCLVAAWVADRRGRPIISGVVLGLAVAIKLLLVPVVLWPLVRRDRDRWGMFGATLASGLAATLVGFFAAGPRATLDWLTEVSGRRPDGWWDNASLPGAVARLFRENQFAEPIATLPWMEPVVYVVGIGAVILTAVKARRDAEMGLWALVAVSLLTTPFAWHNYLVLLGPGILLLLARGRVALALLLLALQLIPPSWFLLWQDGDGVMVTLALTLYSYILVAHWLAFLTHGKEAAKDPATPA